MELIDKGEIVRFKGQVVLTRGTDVIKSNTMETSKLRDKVNANGHVELLRNLPTGEKIKAYGDRGFFNTQTGDGYLIGNRKQSHVIYSQILSATATRTTDVFAERFDFSQTTSTGLASGRVSGKTTDPNTGDHFQFWSSSAAIDQTTQLMRLTGPTPSKLRQDTAVGHRILEGDTITVRSDGRTLFAEGNARAVFIDEIPNKEASHGADRP
jgi:lipopolysaccharide export system protein LptA